MKKTVLIALASVAVGVLATLAITSQNKESAIDKVKVENVKQAAARDAEISLGAPVVEWDKTEYDFGTINQGDKVETTFEFTNVGKGDLIVTSVKGSCGCTTPKWPKEPVTVKPGESKTIDVAFNSRGKKNKTTNTVTLTTNTESGKEVVRIKAFVNAPKKDS
ncbi:DUF1573 domain-containing protein [Urechidicola croceus]|uniref:DUF1573 domain-containing protein n=1 Tax=Urechidicola croceus TaxID=1850246 RepID=A0A1D8P4A7_9FLAO|nr:DUF1573 domain-containing protein [Urechidicola croceus]AOW19409.1 hypothetical protein LPB138_01340 [Urechidicola croceus]